MVRQVATSMRWICWRARAWAWSARSSRPVKSFTNWSRRRGGSSRSACSAWYSRREQAGRVIRSPVVSHNHSQEQDMTSVLFQPFHLHDLTLPNRIVLAPLTRSRAGTARVPNRLMAEYYSQRSSAGLLITEATTISEEGNGWNQTPGVYIDEMTEGWKHTTNAVHEKGGVIVLQLWHTGRASHSSFHGGKPAVAPSAIKINEPDIHTPTGKQPLEVPRSLETSEIPRIVEDYRRAAERAKEAGFDGVELHGANGYLIDTFLQSKTNDRTDEYGGSIENRYRFLKEVIEGVISVWPTHRVGVHLSPNG